MPRTAPRPTRKPTQQRAAPFPCVFVCTACGTVQHTRTPTLPEGWATETIDNDIFAYCADDAIDLPRRSSVQ